MKQLKFTTSKPMGMFDMLWEEGKPLIKIEGGEVLMGTTQATVAYIHDDAEVLAGFDIPIFLDGDIRQLDLHPSDQDILMMLETGEYPIESVFTKGKNGREDRYYLILKQ